MGTEPVPGVQQLVHEVEVHIHLLPRLGMGGAIYLLPHMPSWRGQEKILLFLPLMTWFLNYEQTIRAVHHVVL
jgi:hypothetical protein